MTVRVVFAAGGDLAPAEEIIPDGVRFVVDGDGELYVHSDSRGVAVVFARGRWIYAVKQ